MRGVQDGRGQVKALTQMVWSLECSSGPNDQMVLRPEIDELLDLYDREELSSS